MPNRLAGETSPYLLQHAGNPVDWFPWGTEALARARAEDRPILLSIGYAACHWCHVMARECFEEPAIAALMNRLFVNVKVDREERPDLDQFYQAAAQVLGSSGGWPLTVFCLPDGGPFFAGTYFPPADRPGRPGFPTVLEAVARAYRERRPEVEALARQARETVERLGRPRAGDAVSRASAEGRDSGEAAGAGAVGAAPSSAAPPTGRGAAVVAAAVRGLLRQADPVHGGFGGAPKFPMAPGLSLLLWSVGRLGRGEEREAAGQHALLTLRRMAAGGVCDQLGGGFHRYAVDAAWTVPHFEKMLYDNALLLPLYAGASALAGDEPYGTPAESEAFAATARRTAGFLLREMAAPEGGFCASLDADSPGPDGRTVEGYYYTWTPAELAEVLGSAEAAEAARLLGVTEEGDVEGRSVLRLVGTGREVGAALDAGGEAAVDAEAVAAARLGRWRERLLAARHRRPRPARDDKVIAGWNGLAIAGLAAAGAALGEPAWLDAARCAAAFVLEKLRSPDGGLLRAWRGRPAPAPGFLEDHAYLCLGLLHLYRATLEARWLTEAGRVAEQILERFWVPDEGWFRTAPHLTGKPAGEPPGAPAGALAGGARPGPAAWAEVHDGSLPAAGAAAVLALILVHQHTGEGAPRAAAEAALRAQAGELSRRPHACTTLAMAWDLAADGPTEVTFFGDPADPVLVGWRARLGRLHLPDLVLKVGPGDGAAPAATVCRRFTCRGPVLSWADLTSVLHDPA